MSPDRYVIWSFEHDGWWKPGRWGYTPYLQHAGRYVKAEADEIVTRANRYSATVNEVAVLEPDAADRFPSWECPRCHWRTYNRHDIAEQYCGHCHDWNDR